MSSPGQLPVIPSDPKSGGKRKQKHVHNLNDLTVKELHDRAAMKKIPGHSKMNKAQLVEALRKKH